MAHDDDRGLAAFLDDLEQQAQGAWAGEREQEVAERARAEYARVGLAGRLMAGLGTPVALQVTGVGGLAGGLVRVADGWLLLAAGGAEWLVLIDAVETVRGLPARAVPVEAWPVTARLGVGSALRAMAGDRCVVRLRAGGQLDGRVGRAGADFVELQTEAGTVVLIALAAVAAVRR
jgi:hypothetical protein